MTVSRRNMLIAPLATTLGTSALMGCSLSDRAPDSSFFAVGWQLYQHGQTQRQSRIDQLLGYDLYNLREGND